MTRDYDVEELRKYELSNHSQYLTKEKTSYGNSLMVKTTEDHQEEPYTKRSVSQQK